MQDGDLDDLVADALDCTQNFYLFLCPFEQLCLVVPLESLIKWFSHPHSEKQFSHFDLVSSRSLMHNLLGLETEITLNQLDQRQSGLSNLNSALRTLPINRRRGHSENINQDGVLLQVAQIEIIDMVLEAEQSVVDRLKAL